MEDVFVTGMCAQASNIGPVDHVGFTNWHLELDPCNYAQAIAIHYVTSKEMRKMYKQVLAKGAGCSKIMPTFRNKPEICSAKAHKD